MWDFPAQPYLQQRLGGQSEALLLDNRPLKRGERDKEEVPFRRPARSKGTTPFRRCEVGASRREKGSW